MKPPMPFPSDSTPPRFMSVEGLSSPFRDRPVTLTVFSHVIDISPSPPPSVLASLSGRFENTLSPNLESLTEVEPIRELEESNEFSSPESTIVPQKAHQPIGLGLGIDTGEGTFTNFLPVVDEAPKTSLELPWGLKDGLIPSRPFTTRLLSRRSTSSPLGAPIGIFKGQDEWESQHSLIESKRQDKELDNVERNEPDGERIDLKEITAKINPSKIYPSPDAQALPGALPITLHKEVAESENSPLTRPRVPRGLLFNQPVVVGDYSALEKTRPELEVNQLIRRTPELPDDSAFDRIPPASKVPLLMTFSPRGQLLSTLRYRIRGRGIDASDEISKAAVTTSPDADDMRSSTSPSVPGLFAQRDSSHNSSPMVSEPAPPKKVSPLELPSSPAFPVHSPTLRSTPGSFSPLMHDSTAFSPSMVNVAQAHGTPMHSGATTIVFSILAGCLGFVGISLILFAFFWKRNDGRTGFSFWRRKPRGTAYDEFMEEKIWWMADKKLEIHRQTKPSFKRVLAGVDEKWEVDSFKDEDDTSVTQITRSTSQAPSIPPLAHIIDGKLSLDSLRLEFPSPSPTVSSLSSGISCNYEDHLRDTDYKLISGLKNRPVLEDFMAPQDINLIEDKNLVNRTRSDSKSSIISKASLKSISSIASFIMSITKFDSSSLGKKKGKIELGISSEDYKDVRHSFNSSDDPFSKASPQRTKKKGSKGTLNQSIKRVDPQCSPIRPASVHLEKINYSPASQEASKRPNTMSFITPAILITDHPSELIPPSPPRSSTYSQRPESIGSFLSRYTSSNYNPDFDLGSHESHSPYLQEMTASLSTPNPHFTLDNDLSVADLVASKVKRPLSSRGSLLTSGLDWSVKDSGIDLISNLISNWSPRQTLDLSTAKFDPSLKRLSLNTVDSSQTIRDLAAVTEDLRILIDSEMDPDSSLESPSHFHQSVPDWISLPSSFMVKPPTRPPKSARRYSNMKPSIEFESTSIPCSPNDPSPISGSQYIEDYRNGSKYSSVPTINDNPETNVRMTSTLKKKRTSTGSQVQKSNSDDSIKTTISAGSNASIFEVGSLHTAQSVRGASAEFVARQSIIQSIEAYNRLRMSNGMNA